MDSVVNRTLIPKITNIKIGNKAPSKYLSEIQEKSNLQLENSLKTHFIDTDILNGQYDNNMIFFLELRAEEIFKQINSGVLKKLEEIRSDHYEEPSFDKQSQVKVFARYYKNIVEGVFNPKTNALQYNGELFDSPSGAGMKAKIDLGAPEGTTVNGWTFWRYIDPYNNEEIFIDSLRNEKVG